MRAAARLYTAEYPLFSLHTDILTDTPESAEHRLVYPVPLPERERLMDHSERRDA